MSLDVPFPKNTEPVKDLVLIATLGPTRGLRLYRENSKYPTLPGQPSIDLSSPQAASSISQFLEEDLLTPDLDSLSPHLWIVSTPRSSHISPLHHQLVRDRSIIITENPQLHLIWFENRIFIKPIPQYLLSHSFWTLHLSRHHAAARKAAFGFLRSYLYLIRHESDFRIAQKEGLIPDVFTTLEDFSSFTGHFKLVPDTDVSPRFADYGELRLGRLNLLTRIFLFPKRLTYFHIYRQWGAYFASMFAPLLIVFVVLSIILGSMQVLLAVLQLSGNSPPALSVENNMASTYDKDSWAHFSDFSRWFSIVALVFTGFVVLVSLGVVLIFGIHDVWFARRFLHRKRRFPIDEKSWREISSAVVW